MPFKVLVSDPLEKEAVAAMREAGLAVEVKTDLTPEALKKEIALLIKAGETIGFWPTIALLVAAAALGIAVIRARGATMVGRVFGAMGDGRLPFEPMLDSYAVIVAGLLLIMPGFLSDVIGLLLLVPPVSHALLRLTVPAAMRRR
jgi:UPF0716 family protein affecting phage T7 exclusion